MKYANGIIELMGAFPGREFKMCELVNYVRPDNGNRDTVRIGVARVLTKLIEAGAIKAVQHEMRGSYAIYIWK